MRLPIGLLAALLAPLAVVTMPPRPPAIVFVSRAPAGEPGVIPGLGPHHHALATGGRLMLREAEGAVRALLPEGMFFDCSDPAPSPDGRRIAFAATVHPDSAWRIWIVNRDGEGLRRVTGDGGVFAEARCDDFDPCWVDARTLCFASTRFPQRSQYAGVPVANLYLIRDDRSGLRRITAERNGAEDPFYDPRTDRILYARWWFNAWRAGGEAAPGITTDPALALPRDSINQWQIVSIAPRDRGPRLAAGSLRSRRDAMGLEPALAADGSVYATYALNLGLSPAPVATGIHRLDPRGGPTQRMAGAIVPASGADPYRDARGLAASSACGATSLPDGGVLFSHDPGARGDFGLYVSRTGGVSPLLDLPGTLELDARVVMPRPAWTSAWAQDPGIGDAADRALFVGGISDPSVGTFSFHCEDVFRDGGLAGAPAREPGLSLRFYALLRGAAGADSAALVREVPVDPRGAILADNLPASVPLFEMLVRSDGTPVTTTHGPALVPGSNAGSAGSVTRCVGCHLGHSRLSVPGQPDRR